MKNAFLLAAGIVLGMIVNSFAKPAFPTNGDNANIAQGMSLRQWYAGQAMSGMCATGYNHDTVARESFAIADAMLKFGE